MSWYINGTLFTGTIITVGSGKDYENINLAVKEAPNNSLLLVDPGSWNTEGDSFLNIDKLIYIRGLGASPEDTILQVGYYGIFSRSGGHGYYENLTIEIEDDWQRAFNASTGGIVTANKVRVLPANVYTYSAGHGNDPQEGIFNFKNCYLTKGHKTFVYCNLSLISLDKVEFDDTPDNYLCSGSLSGDYVITPTEGYGYNYGELTITNGGTIVYTDSDGLNPTTTPDENTVYKVHIFRESGSLELTEEKTVNYLIIAGGGGGGYALGGGGGAGAFNVGEDTLAIGTYPVVVGAGGNGGWRDALGGELQHGQNGGDSSFNSLVSLGGGGGGYYQDGTAIQQDGYAGGCGGGGAVGAFFDSVGGTGSMGYAGGAGQYRSGGEHFVAGGGGGASEVGKTGGYQAGLGYYGGNGGDGIQSSLSGILTYYAGGGGGIGYAAGGSGGLGGGGNGGYGADAQGENGDPNTGGGGGGTFSDISLEWGGNGGSGIVIVRYEYTPAVAPTVQTDPATDESFSSFIANGEVTSSGSISERGFWYTDDNKEPTAADYIESETGEFTTGLFDLAVTAPIPGIDYKVKAFATNDIGTGSGETVTVSLPDAVNAVTVETLPETLITTTSFTANGIITNAGQNWYINGMLFTGTVITATPGQNIYSVIANAASGSLILLSPGTYAGTTVLINKLVYIKGLGALPTDSPLPNYMWTFSTGCNGTIIENTTIGQVCCNDSSNSGQVGTISKCIVGDPNGSTFNLQDNTTRLYFINCQLVRSAAGYTQPDAFSSTPARFSCIFFQKVEFNLTPRYGINYVYGPIAENDHVATPTSGYGYIYNGVLQGTEKITVDGVPNAATRGFVYSVGTIENPNLLDYDGIYTESGDFGEGSFNHLFSGLTEGTNYRYRAYATNPYGTSYGDPEAVVTTEAEPSLDIYAATSIDLTSFSVSGKITYNGGSTPTTRGFVYKIGTGTPTILDKDGIFTESGSFGGDVFSNVFSGLTSNTTYTIAAYATNSYATGYSSTVQVVTLPNLIITTNDCTNITASSFRANATISPSTFGVTVVGFLYTIDEEPYSWQTSSSSGDYTGTANFSKVIGAATNKYYLVKAYVDYRGHTYYGESVLVSTIVLTGITVTPVLPEISIGQTVQLTVVGTYSDSSVVDITNSSFYSAEDLAEFIPIEGQAGAFNVISTTGQIIASVSSGGLIVGMSAGLAKIFIYASEYKTSYNLVVVQPDEGTVDVGGIWDGEIAPGTILPNTNAISIIMDEVMYEGDSQQAYLLGMFDDSPETEAYVSNFDAVWSSSNTDVATVDVGGLIIGVAAGITFIKAVYTLEDSPVQTFTTMVMLRVEAKEGQWVIGQTYQYIPLMPIPNQLFRTTIATSKDRSIDLNIFLCWNKETICWEMTISDPISEEYYVDSIPLFVGEDSMFNLLRLYQYLNIGSCYIVDISGKGTGKPALNNLGVDFLMVWGYTE